MQLTEKMRREIMEAIQAGERALRSLHAAREQLGSAGNWGLLDIFGGNFLTGMLKHSKINQANRCIEEAKYDLDVFQRELQDVDLPQLDQEIDGFLTFADFFFDGLFADILVQSKIRQSQRKVDDTIQRVEYLLSELRHYLATH